MVPTWKRKTERQNWNVEAMASAIDEARSGRLGYRSASKKYGVPRSTLERRVKNKNKIAIEVTKSLGSKQRIFSDAMEADLMRYILRMRELYFGLTLMELRHMAYHIAEQNGIPNLFDSGKELAGYDWVRGFMRRHPNLSVRTPEAISAARARGFNRVNVGDFLDS